MDLKNITKEIRMIIKKISSALVILLVVFACNSSTNESNNETKIAETQELAPTFSDEVEELEGALESTLNMDPRSFGGEKLADQLYIDAQLVKEDNTADHILGSYVGEFGVNKINITLVKAEEWSAEGFSVCAGNFRKLSGTFDLMEDDKYTFTLKEPGDDKYDGVFEFVLDAATKKIEGTWDPYKKEGNSSKNYSLSKRVFKYDPSFGNYPESSQRELTEDDLINLVGEELTEMRNEIYARHGYSFKNKEWRFYFESLDWYMPMGIDIRDQLTDVEVKNIELIYEYETYFEDYYDGFGR